jgi:hypothetical protein
MTITIGQGIELGAGIDTGSRNFFTISSSDFTNANFGYGCEGDTTGFNIAGNFGATQALYGPNLGANQGGNALKSAEILAYWNTNGLTTNTGTYLFNVTWGPGTSTNTARNVVALRFDYYDINNTRLNIGTVDTNNAGWDTPGQDPLYALRAANGTFLLPATFTLIQPTIEDTNDWC